MHIKHVSGSTLLPVAEVKLAPKQYRAFFVKVGLHTWCKDQMSFDRCCSSMIAKGYRQAA